MILPRPTGSPVSRPRRFRSTRPRLKTLAADWETITRDTLTIIDNLAVACAAAGQAARAISLHQTVLLRLQARLGENHLTTLVAMNNLARAYEAGLRHIESIELYEKTLPRLREKLGDDHPIVLTAMCWAGASLSIRRPAFGGGRLVRGHPVEAHEPSWAINTRIR